MFKIMFYEGYFIAQDFNPTSWIQAVEEDLFTLKKKSYRPKYLFIF